MKPALIIAAHHLRRLAKNPGLVVMLAAVPVALALVEYAAFGPSAASGRLPRIKVLVMDEDDTPASRVLARCFTGGSAKDFFEVAMAPDLESAKSAFQHGEASALVRVPRGFQDSLRAGSRIALAFYANPVQTFFPTAADSVLQRCLVVANGMMSQASDPVARTQALSEALAAGDPGAPRPPRLAAVEGISVAIERPPAAKSSGVGSDPREFFAYIFPGLALFGLFFISQALAQMLFRDRRRGLQRRLAMTPASPASIMAGGLLYSVCGLFVLLILLGLIGKLAFRIQLRDTPALVLLGLAFAVFAASLHFAIGGLARTDHGSQAAGGVVILLLSLIGGAFIPIESYPPFLRAIAYLTPNGAVQQGMVDVLVHKRSLAQLGPQVATISVWAVATVAAAVYAERRRLVT